MIPEIIETYRQLEHKKAFKDMLSSHLGKSKVTIEQNWFKGDFNIPLEYQEDVLNKLEKQHSVDKKIKEYESIENAKVWE